MIVNKNQIETTIRILAESSSKVLTESPALTKEDFYLMEKALGVIEMLENVANKQGIFLKLI